jgi:hypothetical protein
MSFLAVRFLAPALTASFARVKFEGGLQKSD